MEMAVRGVVRGERAPCRTLPHAFPSGHICDREGYIMHVERFSKAKTVFSTFFDGTVHYNQNGMAAWSVPLP